MNAVKERSEDNRILLANDILPTKELMYNIEHVISKNLEANVLLLDLSQLVSHPDDLVRLAQPLNRLSISSILHFY
jgi:hypothetical protein